MDLQQMEEFILELIRDELDPALSRDQSDYQEIDAWRSFDDAPLPSLHQGAGNEYTELAQMARSPWLWTATRRLAQNLKVSGYRGEDLQENQPIWSKAWDANNLDSLQLAAMADFVSYGLIYGVVLPGEPDPLGDPAEKRVSVRWASPTRSIALYEDPLSDPWPFVYMENFTRRGEEFSRVILKDHVFTVARATAKGRARLVEVKVLDGVPVTPVVAYRHVVNNQGDIHGIVKPAIGVTRRLQQTNFDRLTLQRFTSWSVRTIAGMKLDDDTAADEKLRLSIDSILISEDPDTKFGSMPASPLDGILAATAADIQNWCAHTQTAATDMLATLVNVGPEAVAASRVSATQLVDEWRSAAQAGHSTLLRLAGALLGDESAARDVSSTIRWADTSPLSFAQLVDGLGKAAQMLDVPAEMLWERIPNWTVGDTVRAREIQARAKAESPAQQVINSLDRQSQPAALAAATPVTEKAAAQP